MGKVKSFFRPTETSTHTKSLFRCRLWRRGKKVGKQNKKTDALFLDENTVRTSKT